MAAGRADIVGGGIRGTTDDVAGDATPTTRFPMRIGARSRLFLRVAFGVRADNAWAEVSDSEVAARFGRFGFRTPLENVARWRIEGPWLWITAIGRRRSIRHGDVSFAGSPRGGLRIDLRTPYRARAFHVPAFYLGVEDLDGLAAALAARGIRGEDARKRS